MKTIFVETTERNLSDRLLSRMRLIVKDVILLSKFRSDFETNDIAAMASNKGSRLFAWYVYESGTYLMPLDDMDEVRAFQRDWLDALKKIEGKKESRTDRLYVLNASTGDIRQIFGFKEEHNLAARLLKAVS